MVDQLFDDLSRLHQVEAIALGGSRAGTNFDASSDYDVYLYCTDAVPEESRREILSRYCDTMEIGNHFWEYEDNCRLKNGVDIDILYRDLDDFCAGVAEVVEQGQAHNGYTTCMWHNLNTCKVLFDRSGRLNAAKQRFDVAYPEALKRNIIQRNMRLLHTAMPAYDLQVKKAVKRGDLVSVNHRSAAFMEAYFDVLFALNECTHPGEKRLISLCKERCKYLPCDFEENLAAYFRAMFRDPEGALYTLHAILSNLEMLLKEHNIQY